MHVLITGGAGFIGSHLSEMYLQKGHKVTAIDDLSTGNIENLQGIMKNPDFRFVYETIMNENVLDRLISDCDIVIHLAAAVGVELIISKQVSTMETNINGTDQILKVCKRYRKKVLIASTSEVYGKNEKTPFSESDDFIMGATINGRWSYACSKAIDEFLALAYYKEFGLPVVIVRLFNTVGPKQTGQYGMVVPRFVKQALANEPITVYGDGDQSRCFCHVLDTCEGIMGLLENKDAEGQVVNIGNNFEITIAGLAKKVIEFTNSTSQIQFIPYEKAYDAGFEDMRRRIPNITKAGRLANFKPKRTLDTILGDVQDFMKSTGRR